MVDAAGACVRACVRECRVRGCVCKRARARALAYVCVRACMRVLVSVCLRACACVCIRVCPCVRARARVRMRVWVCLCTCRARACVSVCVRACKHACVRAYVRASKQEGIPAPPCASLQPPGQPEGPEPTSHRFRQLECKGPWGWSRFGTLASERGMAGTGSQRPIPGHRALWARRLDSAGWLGKVG